MNKIQTAQNAAQIAREPLEALRDQLIDPIYEEARHELLGFIPKTSISAKSKEIAKNDLAEARGKKMLEMQNFEDLKKSEEKAQKIKSVIQVIAREYQNHETRDDKNQKVIKTEIVELKEEIKQLAKTAGVETKAHLETMPQKVGSLDIKRLTNIVKTLKIKANEAKSVQELQGQRQNAKRTTGMLAWVSGKQMKIHEQGTLTLQG